MNASLVFIEFVLLIITTSSLPNYNFSIVNDLEAATTSNEIKLPRKGRDVCTEQATLDIMNKAIDSMNNIENFRQAVSSIAAVPGSLFGFQAVSSCDLDSKLDLVLEKLQEIAEKIKSIGSLLECTQMKQNYPDLVLKIKTLLNLYHIFYQPNKKEEAREELKSRCKDHTEGINKIYNMFLNLLDKDQVVDFFKNCAGYQSINVNIWSGKIKQLAFTIMLLIQGCEEVYDGITDFDPFQFINEVENFTHYYSETTNKDEFVKDQSVFGLKEKVKSVVNQDQSAEETAKLLNQSFNYFYWDVIFYTSKVYGYDHHCVFYQPNNSYCGSRFYKRELNHDKNAVVAWCVHNSLEIHMVTFPQDKYDDAQRTANKIIEANKEANKQLKYVLVVKPPTDVDVAADYNQRLKGNGRMADSHKLIYTSTERHGTSFKDTFIATSWFTSREEPQSPKLQFQIKYLMFRKTGT
jgi:hypothetical protein